MKKSRKILVCTIAVLVAVLASFFVYVSKYYHALPEENTYLESESNLSVVTLKNGDICFVPDSSKVGMIFYPGGKVDYKAYAPLMKTIAQKGFLCVLVKMPCNLAVFNINGADGIASNFPNVKEWYIGGHSLGGAMASEYAARFNERSIKKGEQPLRGLILLGAYSVKDLKDKNISVLTMYGSEDGVLNKVQFEKCKKNLPDNAWTVVIPGGSHAYFGMYGYQKGDGIAIISNEE